MNSWSACGRIRLPTWVVRILSVLRFMMCSSSRWSWAALDHRSRPQLGDLTFVIAELGEHFIGVLSERRRRQRALLALAVDEYRAMDGRDLTLGRMALLVEGLEMAYLRIVEHVLQALHRRERHVVLLELGHPMVARLRLEHLGEHAGELAIVRNPQVAGGEAFVAHEIGALERRGDRLEEFSAAMTGGRRAARRRRS